MRAVYLAAAFAEGEKDYTNGLRYVLDRLQPLTEKVAALEQEKDAAKSMTMSVQSANDILREVIREKATELGTRWSCVCYLPAIHEPCVRCRFIASLRALTEGEK
jgi:hypothetical protein